MRFCPHCGKETLAWKEERKWHCSSCGFTLFHNVAGAVAVIIKHHGKILFTRRNKEPKKNKLDLPGGFTDPKESSERTCVRELSEELNINIDEKKLKYLGSLPNTYLYKEVLYNTIDLFFEYLVESDWEITLEKEEISEIVWKKPSEISPDEIAFDSQKKFLEAYFKNSPLQ